MGLTLPNKVSQESNPNDTQHVPFLAPLAQLVEQLTLNQRVLGSSPRWRTNNRRRKNPKALKDTHLSKYVARWSSG